jgi:succinate dehydrogenase / fumarate reductase, cytochrome b subunit
LTATRESTGTAGQTGGRKSPPRVMKKVRHRSIPLLDLYQTGVGKKWVMAVTGIGLMGFVFVHMFGNLKLYFGAEEFDAYAYALREIGYPFVPKNFVLWGFRAGLLVMFVLHIHSAWSLTMMNRRARPTSYSRRDYIAASFASRTMRWTGIIVALFLLWHIADLTMGWVDPNYVYGNVYDNVVSSFSRVPVAAFYVVAMVALGNHLYHGIWSLFQTVGSMNPRFDPRRNPLRRGFAAGFTIVVIGANISFPLAVQFGIVG